MTDPVESTAVHWRPRIALAFVVVGLALTAVGFAHVDGVGVWSRIGSWCWVVAYFLVLHENYVRRLRVLAREGLETYAQGAFRAAMSYALLAILGLVATGILLAFMLMGDGAR